MRVSFGKAIFELAKKDPLIHLIVGDIGWGIFDEFRKSFPERFHNFGIMEQSMVSIAAGMSIAGLHPYVFTITPFLLERAFEQIKIDIDSNNVMVKLIGYCDYPDQGVTHENFLFKDGYNPFKNIRIYHPKDSHETVKFLLYEALVPGPCIISMKRCPLGGK
jgi:transketolase